MTTVGYGDIVVASFSETIFQIIVLSVGISSILSSSIYYIISKVIKTENDASYLFIFCFGIILNIISIVLTFYEKDEMFSFYRVNFLQEKTFLQEKDIKDLKQDEENNNESSKDIYEMEDKSSINTEE